MQAHATCRNRAALGRRAQRGCQWRVNVGSRRGEGLVLPWFPVAVLNLVLLGTRMAWVGEVPTVPVTVALALVIFAGKLWRCA